METHVFKMAAKFRDKKRTWMNADPQVPAIGRCLPRMSEPWDAGVPRSRPWAGPVARVGNKNPPKKTHLKNPLKCFWVFTERNKINTQSRADAYIRRKRLICKSDYNLKPGCTKKYSWNWKNPKNSLFWANIWRKKNYKKQKNEKTHWAGFFF